MGLEYLKVLLTAPVIFGAVSIIFICTFKGELKALINRIAEIKFPGGGVSTPQSSRLPEDKNQKKPEPPQQDIQSSLPLNLPPEQRKAVEDVIRSHISNAYLWEYRYLNYFLARGTQAVLDWLSGFNQPITIAQYNSNWLPIIPSAHERQLMITVLEAHQLIIHDRQMDTIVISEKGKEYREWRGQLPPPPPPPAPTQ